MADNSKLGSILVTIGLAATWGLASLYNSIQRQKEDPQNDMQSYIRAELSLRKVKDIVSKVDQDAMAGKVRCAIDERISAPEMNQILARLNSPNNIPHAHYSFEQGGAALFLPEGVPIIIKVDRGK